MLSTLFDLSGKVALVTGATHGLGMSMAMGLGEAGATIVVNGRSSDEKITCLDRIIKGTVASEATNNLTA